MSLAPNVLLQTNAATTAKSTAASHLSKSADIGKDSASGFSKVFNRESREVPKADRDVQANAARDKNVPEKSKSVAAREKPDEASDVADGKSSVAESGNDLPADKVVQANDQDRSDEKGDDSAAQSGTDSTTDQAVQAMAANAQAGQGPLVPLTVPAATAATDSAIEEAFDPEVDPLEGLHALQFALESAGGKTRPGAAPATQTSTAQNGALVEGDAADAQNVVNNLASLQGGQDLGEDGSEGSEKSLAGLLDDGLKDVKAASGDTRVDNFAERLAALSQAAQPARTAPVTTPVINQPLAMHQSGWSEGIVERVMYLSSQNLKSAEIKLEPAELGRLDIRVNMAPDQQTQVTFVSAHLGVRDALESQMVRLRESFQQQGLGQVDVNVSDQSQQQAQQQAQEQASRAQRGSSRSDSGVSDGGLDGSNAEPVAAVSQPVQRVIGSSEIDYYA
ncbi:flagellar hook-length control protein FliK [Pseudomonas sp. 3A(2025)]